MKTTKQRQRVNYLSGINEKLSYFYGLRNGKMCKYKIIGTYKDFVNLKNITINKAVWLDEEDKILRPFTFKQLIEVAKLQSNLNKEFIKHYSQLL